MVVCDTPQKIRQGVHGDVVEIQPDDWRAARQLAADLPGVREVQTYGETLHLLVDSGERRLPQIERTLKKEGVAFHGARIAPTRMEEAFISLIRKLEA
jgi:hypothetical protein